MLLFTILIIISSLVIIVVGQACYTNGYYYILEILNNEEIAMIINKILLVSYYLVNLGYSIFYLKNSIGIRPSLLQFSNFLGSLLIILAILHYGNMIGIYLIKKYKIIKN